MRKSPDLAENSDTPPWRSRWRWVASGLLAFHVMAVFMGPFAFSTRTPGGTSSDFAEWLLPVFRPYIQALYLDHGYAFFAPDPGPSHLVKYKVEFADGRDPVEGMFPDLKTERPRLLYHRHFMLSEQLHSSYAPPAIDTTLPPPLRSLDPMRQGAWDDFVKEQQADRQESWQRDRAAYEARWNSFERHLQRIHGGSSVSMARIEHRPADPLLVDKLKFRLNDESLYRTLTKDDAGGPR